MKRISMADLRSAAETNPQLWHDAFSVGRMVDGVAVEVPDDFPISAPMPSAYRQIVNAAGAAGRVIKSMMLGESVFVSDLVAAMRQTVCEDCPQHQAGRCTLCGCCTEGNILNKTTLATERCPEGKW